ncbi:MULTISPECIES: hypothetical protein [unclassified Streptomyces]|uniref:hypothetical protein n=1 Tax=unclassified Streptomyces TaxID=2593676 RepID=UPI002E2B12A0|nr:hypothetical protein [Streptomyces sp. NBC_00228]
MGAATAKGRSGSGVTAVNTVGAALVTLKVFKEPTAASVRTTIDVSLQAAAEKAVHDQRVGGKPAGVVSIDRPNGHVRAVAYDGPDGDIVVNAAKAPGSTMKISTSAALFDQAGMTPDSTGSLQHDAGGLRRGVPQRGGRAGQPERHAPAGVRRVLLYRLRQGRFRPPRPRW